MATLKEVARIAGVSTATVSKVLSNTPYVSEETRQRVMQAVHELGYTPNLAARALSKGRTYVIGVIFPRVYYHLLTDPLIVAIVEGVESVCTERGYNVLLSTPRAPASDTDQYQRLVRSGYLDGVIVIETLPDPVASGLLEEHDYPWVVLGYHSGPGVLNTLHLDDFDGARMIAAYLLGLGHRRIGVIAVDRTILTAAEQRLEGYKTAFAEAGLEFDRLPREDGDFSMESGYHAAGLLRERAPDLTAFLCINDRMAMGAIQRLKALGLHVPHDMSVVGFDDVPGASFFDPPLTTVKQPAHEMGQQVARMLFEIIDEKSSDKDLPYRKFAPIVVPTELIVRESSAPLQRG